MFERETAILSDVDNRLFPVPMLSNIAIVRDIDKLFAWNFTDI